MIYVCRIDTGKRHIFDFADGIEKYFGNFLLYQNFNLF